MIYRLLKSMLLALLQAPAGPPAPPAGSPGSEKVFRAAPRFLVYKLAVNWLGLVPAAIFLVIASLGARTPAPLLFLALAVAGATFRHFLIRLDYDLRYYIVTDRSLRIRAGVMHLTEVTLTYANVQAININQNFVQRWLGISDLIVQTAGGGAPVPGQQSMAHRGVLRGIDNPEQMRDEIMALVRQFRDAGLGDPEDIKRAGGDVRMERLREIRDELRVLRQRLP